MPTFLKNEPILSGRRYVTRDDFAQSGRREAIPRRSCGAMSQ